MGDFCLYLLCLIESNVHSRAAFNRVDTVNRFRLQGQNVVSAP